MAGDEMDIAPESFAKQSENPMLRVASRNAAHCIGKIEGEIEGHTVGDFGFKEEDVFERGDEFRPSFGAGLVVGQFAESVRGGVAVLAVAVWVSEGL